MSNYQTGHDAEKHAAKYLEKRDFEILDINWRRRRCEIDLVAKKAGTVHFVEVKYRRSSAQGSGLDYITAPKLRQMAFAAEMWVAENNWSGEYVLSAIELTGEDFVVTNFIENIA